MLVNNAKCEWTWDYEVNIYPFSWGNLDSWSPIFESGLLPFAAPSYDLDDIEFSVKTTTYVPTWKSFTATSDWDIDVEVELQTVSAWIVVYCQIYLNWSPGLKTKLFFASSDLKPIRLSLNSL